MTNVKAKSIRTALIALITAAPLAACAAPQSGSPEQPVAQDPAESVEGGTAYMNEADGQIVDSPKADQGVGSDMNADVVRELDAEDYNDSAKSDG
jgi:hypothetical protein